MHYIVGTTLMVTNRPKTVARPGMSSSDLRQIKSSRGVDHDKLSSFVTGVEYTLSRIHRPRGESCVVYCFTDGAARVELKFDSVSQAEAFISGVRGDTLPTTYTQERTD